MRVSFLAGVQAVMTKATIMAAMAARTLMIIFICMTHLLIINFFFRIP